MEVAAIFKFPLMFANPPTSNLVPGVLVPIPMEPSMPETTKREEDPVSPMTKIGVLEPAMLVASMAN